jgi:hypothetical protein
LVIYCYSSEEIFNYWVKGMSLLAVSDYKPEAPGELSISKGEVVVFLGQKDDRGR